METNPLRGLLGVSPPRPEEQRVDTQPTEPTENVYFEIPSGMIEKLLANPFAGDGTLHPDLHLIFVDEVCGLVKLAGIPDDVVKRKVFPLYKRLSRLVLCYKKDLPSSFTLFTFITCYLLQITLSQNYLLPIIPVLAENTLLKTVYHFLLLLVGFGTLTYQKDYARSPILVGHQDSFLVPLLGSEAPLVGGIW